ncbi:MAG: F0F1 ATP synthase subunit epsilon [Candidatus Brocadiia bacterium]
MFRVNILNQKEVVYEGLVESVFLPGEGGELEILAFHMPVVCTLRPGRIRINDLFFDVRGGIARMDQNNELLILTY